MVFFAPRGGSLHYIILTSSKLFSKLSPAVNSPFFYFLSVTTACHHVSGFKSIVKQEIKKKIRRDSTRWHLWWIRRCDIGEVHSFEMCCKRNSMAKCSWTSRISHFIHSLASLRHSTTRRVEAKKLKIRAFTNKETWELLNFSPLPIPITSQWHHDKIPEESASHCWGMKWKFLIQKFLSHFTYLQLKLPSNLLACQRANI